MFPFLPAYEDKCGLMDTDYKYRSINIITGLILILDSLGFQFSSAYMEISVPCLFPLPRHSGGPEGCLAGAHLSASGLACYVAASQVGSLNVQVLNLLAGLCSGVITPAIAASATSVLLS